MSEEKKVFVEITYKDDSTFSFDVICHSEKESEQLSEIMMITRGTLMSSMGIKATAYNNEGFPLCSYIK